MAAEAIVSKVLEELPLVIAREIEQGVRLVVGVRKEVQTLTSRFKNVKAVLADAEDRLSKEHGVKQWMSDLKNISYDMDDVVDEWSTAIGKSLIKGDDENAHDHNDKKKVLHFLTCLSCFRCCREVGLRHDIAVRIKDLNEQFNAIMNEQRLFKFSFHQMETTTQQVFERPMTTSLLDVEEVKGREHEKEVIINKLLNESSQTPKLHIISIIGMGGIGKTTLASLAYSDSVVKAHFQERIWVCVSDPFDEVRVSKAILESLSQSAPNLVELQTVLQKIQQSLEGKKFLLVLDDVWEEHSSKWDNLKRCLKCGSAGSRILVTTRKENATRAIGCKDVYPIGQLSEPNCWLLFSQIAFFGWGDGERQQLEDIGRKIVSKCKGLPLAVRSVAGVLHSKKSRTEWQSIFDSGVWELEIAEVDVFPHLWFSYRDLSPALRQCFLYCAIFPKDYEIEKHKLIESWMAHGYLWETQAKDMETLGERYFETLAARSFFQEFEIEEWSGRIERCKMHDIVHDFALYMTRNESFSIEVRGDSVQESGSASASVGCKESRHSRIMLSSTKEDSPSSFPSSVYDEKKLRGLIIDSDWYSRVSVLNALPNLFDKLIWLRSLDLSDCSVEQIPLTISKLIHLRRLDLSENEELKELPEAVGELYNLQTLDIRGCEQLEKLPHGIGKLDNLRHLHNLNPWNGGVLPKGIGRLSCLRALDMVDVGHEEEKDAFCLADFEKLNRLQGYLVIKGLGNVRNLSGAKQALKNKSQIFCLSLSFKCDHTDKGGEESESESKESESESTESESGHNEELLQVLEPPPNLEMLDLADYNGTSFSPSWLLSLTHLKHLELRKLNNCERLPPNLGKLPCLESIGFYSFTNLKRAGVEFWGVEEDSRQTSSVPLFPKLRKLEFWNFENWEEWDDDEVMKTNVIIMPCLRTLSFEYCPKLKTLPQLLLQNKITPKEELKIDGCPILAERYNKEKERTQPHSDSDWSKIFHISRIRIGGQIINR